MHNGSHNSIKAQESSNEGHTSSPCIRDHMPNEPIRRKNLIIKYISEGEKERNSINVVRSLTIIST